VKRSSRIRSAALRRSVPVRLGLFLLTLLSLLGAAAGNRASLQITGTVNANWRGVYDILVQPGSFSPSGGTTRGLVEANYLATGGRGGISLDQWRAVRALPDVDVAAPIAAVGFVQAQGGLPGVSFPLAPGTNLYGVTARFEVSDGLRWIRVAAESGLVLGRGATSTSAPALDSTFLDYSADNRPGGSAYVTISRFPITPGLVVAIDPSSEAALLGTSAGFGALRSLPPSRLLDTSTFPLEDIPKRFRQERGQINLVRLATAGKLVPVQVSAKPVIPLLLNSTATPPVRVSWTVSRQPIASVPAQRINRAGTELLQQLYRPGAPSRIVSGGASTLPHFGLPLSATDVLLTPSGIAPLSGGGRGPTSFSARLPERPSYQVLPGQTFDPGVPAFRIRPLGAAPAGTIPKPGYYPSYVGTGLPVTAKGPVREERYRSLNTFTTSATLTAGSNLAPFEHPYYLAPLGTFDLGAIFPSYDPLNYAPLGAYDPANTQLVRGPDRTPIEAPRDVRPTFNPAGFIVSPPAAFTNIPAARLLKGSSPIDAIRVRLSGLGAFDAQARDELAAVAEQIRALGLRATIVAGSSPRPVDLYIPEYFGVGKDLGWVRQQWTSLGAAAQIVSGLGRVRWLLLSLVLLVASLFTLVVQVLTVRTQTATMALLRSVGWSRRDVVRSIVGLSIRDAVLVAAIGSVGAPMLRRWGVVQGDVAWFPIALAILWLTASVVGARVATSIEPTSGARSGEVRRGWPPRVVTPLGYAVRQVTARPGRAALQSLALGLGAATLAVAIALLIEASGRAGPTALAAFTSAAARADLVAMAAVASVLVLLGAAMMRHEDLVARSGERRALSRLGWDGAGLTRALRTEFATMTVLALPLAAVVAALGGLVLGVGAARTGGLVALAGVLAVAAGALIERLTRQGRRASAT
jgi:hypothetical protein